MSIQVQYRRGSEAENNAFTGALGEITVDTTNDSIRIHDGSTAGGFETNAKEALYADVAERYHADAIYGPGVVVVFGGNEEITQSTQYADARVLGVISTNPYCVMNSPHRRPDLTNEYHPPVALLGRVPTFVVGTVRKGDIMVSSSTPGHACAWQASETPPAGSIIGKAVQSKDNEGPGTIEIVIGR
jgi:hypothetical protein